MRTYNKLVRDKIPEIIKANGETPVTRTLDDDEYLKELVNKLKEEVSEFQEDNSLEELADIQEVVNALAAAIGKTVLELEEIRSKKADERGGFKDRIFLEMVE